MADALVVHGDDARTAEHLVLDDDATRDVTAALQRNVVPDHDIDLDVDIRTDRAPLPDERVAADHHVVAYARAVTDGDVRENRAELSSDLHLMSLVRLTVARSGAG